MTIPRTKFNQPNTNDDSYKYVLANAKQFAARALNSVVLGNFCAQRAFVECSSMRDNPEKVGAHSDIDHQMDVEKV